MNFRLLMIVVRDQGIVCFIINQVQNTACSCTVYQILIDPAILV
jgi:hypothetical protein